MSMTAGAKVEDYVSKIEKAVEEGKINQLNYIVLLLQSEFTYILTS